MLNFLCLQCDLRGDLRSEWRTLELEESEACRKKHQANVTAVDVCATPRKLRMFPQNNAETFFKIYCHSFVPVLD